MALKAVVKDINTVAEAYRTEYKQQGDEWRLDIDGDLPGFVPQAKFAEFRDNNKKLIDEKNTLLTQLQELKEIDPVEYKRLQAEAGKKGKGETEKEYQERLAAALKPLQTEIENHKTENAKVNGELSKLKINDAAIAAGAEFGIKTTAQQDLINRISATAKIENGVVVLYDEKGEKRYSNKTGELLTIREAVGELTEKAAHLFEPSTGTQSKGPGGQKTGGTGPNPFMKATWNVTRQGEILRDDKPLAIRLATEAGVKLRA